MKMYETLARELEQHVMSGMLKAGDKVPSVRQLSQQRDISITTVLKAYSLLESRGVIESRPQSGYFVRKATLAGHAAAMPAPTPPTLKPHPVASNVEISQLVLRTLKTISRHDAVPLGSPYPDPTPFPLVRLSHLANNIAKKSSGWGVLNDLPPGNIDLIRQIAGRYFLNGLLVDPAEVIITVGATEALNLCLQAAARPGDTIAVESPTYYAILHAIERMGMRAIEIPTSGTSGMDVDYLESILESDNIAACMVMPNFHNPLGIVMPEANKKKLVEIMTRAKKPIIENAVYNELYYSDTPPSSLKQYDTEGYVLHCSSFSKTLSSAFRIGWAMPGRYREKVENLKFVNTLSTSAIPQMAIAEYLSQGGYDQHLRKIRKFYQQQAKIITHVVRRFFPEACIISEPAGGYLLWVQLPPHIDAMRLYNEALERKITIGPGTIFSNTGKFRNCIRLNYSYSWSKEIESAIVTLGKIISHYK
ncbi:PLP-dependent aminotransferase family protein [Chromobacterium subtsugae]|uniref:aminotransferase-like domain-containing protein n=1 Tax=Chromobacterium subtsugae TaxID=251747 RepID=UPI000641417D|nr:PLP-dependent aminotransferase family protein [Chromobacterium subtsugae]